MIERPTLNRRALYSVGNIAGRSKFAPRCRRLAGGGRARPLRRQEAGLEVHAGAMADATAVEAQPLIGLVAPRAEQVVEHGPVRLPGAIGAERARVAAGLDEVEAVRRQAAVAAAR